jgi:hypothetical protein
MKNHVSWHGSDQAEWAGGLPAERSLQAAGRTIPGIQTVCGFLLEESANGAGLVHDLVEKLWLGNNLVHVLTEIDTTSGVSHVGQSR